MPRTAKYMNERVQALLKRNRIPRKTYLGRRSRGWDEFRAATTPVDKSKQHQSNKYKIYWHDDKISAKYHVKIVSGTQRVADFLTHKLNRTITKNMIVSRFYAKRRPVRLEKYFIEREEIK